MYCKSYMYILYMHMCAYMYIVLHATVVMRNLALYMYFVECQESIVLSLVVIPLAVCHSLYYQAIQAREELTERVQETEDEMELVLGDLHKSKTELTKLKQVTTPL